MSVYTLTEFHKKAITKTLMACPFCGFREPSVVEIGLMRHIECKACGASTKESDNVNAAVASWNTRR